MSKAPEISIVIPCCNEEENIKIAVEQLSQLKSQLGDIELVFVDDGSRDRTYDLLSEISKTSDLVRIHRHPTNLGLGAAIRSGLEASRGEIIVTTDCDGTYGFQDIPKIIEKLKSGFDVITASPYHPQGKVENVHGYRLLLSKACSLVYRMILRTGIYTFTSLFRAYRRVVVENIKIESNGFLGGTELLVKAIRAGYRVGELPATLRTRERGVSKAKLFATTKAHIRFQLSLLK